MDQFYRNPPDHATVLAAVQGLSRYYGALKVFPIGKSVLGREIPALCIGSPMGATVLVGGTHGLEWLTVSVLLRFCHELLEALCTEGEIAEIDACRAMQGRSLVIIPCLNPDGIEIALHGKEGALHLAAEVEQLCGGNYNLWQANANGVDLNHNFDAGWNLLHKLEQQAGITGPAPTRYGGPHPCSEPETCAITTYCMTWQPKSLYAIHSQGEEIYYYYGRHTPSRSRLMAQILAVSSGYRIARPTGLASHGGLKDWFIDKLHRPGFTIEIGCGKNPLPLSDLDEVYGKIHEMLMLAALL